MEGLGKKIGILGIAFLGTGMAINFAPRAKQVDRTEPEIAAMLPEKVGRYFADLPKGEYCSYKMDQSNYDILKPWGIVARLFHNGQEKYDVVVIASRNKDSFHDPQVCLTGQGWGLTNQRIDTVSTKTRGEVPITLFDMEMRGEKKTAMYFFKTTQGYYGDISKVKLDMFTFKLKNFGKDDEGAFIRIIPHGTANLDRMKLFAADWIDTATDTSKGYY
jgi:Protein of unknown function (DUF3485)